MGLQSGDIITKIQINNNMFDIKRSFQLGDILLEVRVGDTVKFFGTRQNTNNSTLGVIENVSAEQLVSADSALFQ